MDRTPIQQRTAVRVLLLTFAAAVLVSCSAASGLSNRTPRGKVIDRQGWRMTVPIEWESYTIFGPDSPFIVAYLFASRTAPASTGDSAGSDTNNKPYLKFLVSRLPRHDSLDVELAWQARCDRCPPDRQREVRAVDLHGRWGVREDIVQADGSRVWILVVQNDCYTYTAHVEAPAAHAAEVVDVVDRVFASAAVARTGKTLGRC